MAAAKNQTLRLTGQVISIMEPGRLAKPELLPTPTTSDSNGPGAHGDGGSDLRTVMSVHSGIWGKYQDAIDRWERETGRIHPDPTKPDGRGGKSRLSPEFVEWMMGLPSGWVTGMGLSRKQELKMCGNGVVPQQAKIAMGQLLQRMER